MIKHKINTNTELRINKSVQGEPIENKIRRILANNEPITDGAPINFSDRKDGVLPQADIRTDRWDLAIDAKDKYAQANNVVRLDKIKKRTEPKEEIGKPETIQGTEGNQTA